MKRRKNKGKGNVVFHMSAEEATLRQMPYIVPASRCGAHKSARDYDRKKDKREIRKEQENEE